MPESASERFARAVEGGPVEPDLDESLRRELAVVAALRDVGRSARLDDVARHRMRRRLLAAIESRPDTADGVTGPDTADGVTEREAADGVTGPEPVPAPGRPVRTRAAGVRARLLVAAAAALCLLLSLSAMSLFMARDALPGDALYGVKRSTESAELGFTFGVESRGFKHLQFATARLDELEALAASGAGATTDADPYREALEGFDADAAAGSRLLAEAAVRGNTSLLGALQAWAEQQSQRIQTAAPALPEQAAIRAAESGELLRRIAERAASLRARVGCSAVTTGEVDDIGLLPAGGPCEPVNVAPRGSGSTLPGDPNRPGDQPATSVQPSGPGSLPGGATPEQSVPGGAGSLPQTAQPSQLPQVPLPVSPPELPNLSTQLPLPSLPGF
jgi:hypothetical protein